jgi:hypothetical protein
VEFSGVGGDRMRAAGLKQIFPMSELAVMGLLELVPHLPRLWGRLKHTLRALVRSFALVTCLKLSSPPPVCLHFDSFQHWSRVVSMCRVVSCRVDPCELASVKHILICAFAIHTHLSCGAQLCAYGTCTHYSAIRIMYGSI